MTSSVRPTPDPAAVLLSHFLVGAAVTAVLGKPVGFEAALMVAVAAVAMHHMLDAPFARALASAGI